MKFIGDALAVQTRLSCLGRLEAPKVGLSLVALKRVRWEEDEEAFRIEGGGSFTFDEGNLVIPLDIAGDVSVAHLTRALTRLRDYYGESPEVIYLVESEHDWEPPAARFACAMASFEDGQITVIASLAVDADSTRPPELYELIAPLLAQHRAHWNATWISDEGGVFLSRMVSAGLSGERRSIAELAQFGVDLQEFCGAISGDGELSAFAARNLIAAGRISLLLGQQEGSWLDAKGAPYSLATDADKWELAKDVASFANGGEDAMILLGATTRRTPNGDVVDKPRPFDLREMDVPALRAVLRDRIVPLIPDLDIGVVERRGGYGYGWIRVPAQPAELRPFLVAGAMTGSGYLGTHISIPFRAIEDTAYLDAAAVHSLIAAGRVSLRIAR